MGVRNLTDWKSRPRIKDPALLRSLHNPWAVCAFRTDLHPATPFATDTWRLSLHHILKHPRDDVRGNLVMVCGDGTTGCHGRLEAHDAAALRALFQLVLIREDVQAYVRSRLGDQGAADWRDRLLRSKTGGRG